MVDPAELPRLNVHLTDAPCDYDSVLIDVQGVEVTVDSGKQSLAMVSPGVYNLLALNNGLDTLLGSASLPVGELNQIRLILGTNNQVSRGGILYDLKTPSAQTSGLKIKVQEELKPGITYDIWLDFDACRSVVEKGNGGFNLKPVIRSFTKATSGAISGMVWPDSAVLNISAIKNLDTFGTIPDSTGHFLIQGLDSGTYEVHFEADTAFSDTVLFPIQVLTGQVTELDTISF